MGLGRPTLAKFMEPSHYAYNTLKMPGPLGVITIPSDEKDAIICVDKMYRDAFAAEAAAAIAPAKESKGKKRDCRTSGKESEKRALIRLQRIYNYLLFHAILLSILDVL